MLSYHTEYQNAAKETVGLVKLCFSSKYQYNCILYID